MEVESSILSIGSLNVDFTAGVERRPGVSETLMASSFWRAGGGKGGNVALLCARFGVRSAVLGRVGDDELAPLALRPLTEAGVDASLVRRQSGELTGISMITVPPDGQKGIILAANANRHWEEEATAAANSAVAALAPGSIVVVDFEIPRQVVATAVAAARERELTVLVDPSPAGDVARDLLGQASVAVPNAGEAATLTSIAVDGPETGAKAARRLREFGVRWPVVKLADGGCVVLEGETLSAIPAPEVDVVDSNGAGDAFAGALAVALLEGRGILAACTLAVATASLSVIVRGAQASFPVRDAAEQLAADLTGRVSRL